MSNFDIKAHVQSMAPEAQDWLLKAAVKDHNMSVLIDLMGIIGEQRDPRSVADKVSNWMKEVADDQGTWSEFAEEGLNK